MGSYVLAKPDTKAKSGTAQRFDSVEDVPAKWSILSVGNTIHRCLSRDEMTERGWRLIRGVWRGPEGPAWWKEDSENEELEVVDA